MFGALIPIQPAQALSCMGFTVAGDFADSTAVFIGTAQNPSANQGKAEIKVTHAWKGEVEVGDVVDAQSADPEIWGVKFKTGYTYLIFSEQEEPYLLGLCDSSREVITQKHVDNAKTQEEREFYSDQLAEETARINALIVELNSYANTSDAHPLGTNIISGGTVYTIVKENGKTVRSPYTSAGAFLSYSFNNWSNIVEANTKDLALPIGSFIPPRDGTIMCSDRGADQGTCYLVTDSKKAGFTSEQAFYQAGYNYNWALYGDISFLSSATHIEDGLAQHRPGTVISWNGKTYLVTNAGLKQIPSTEVLSSWGYWTDEIISANSTI